MVATLEELIIAFKLGNEEYGVDVSQIQEIVKMRDITRVPKAPYYIKGVMNLRGNVIPVIDLRKRFSLPSKEATDQSRIIVFDIKGVKFGIVVDAVSEVIRLSKSDIEPPPPIAMGGIEAAYIRGVGKLQNKLIILLDLEKALKLGELVGEEAKE
ncbi:MAG: chemotaxis protein CheW [Synergistetes bacterium]|nr:chemotaxis protein CheW [Synergistota bacterium]MDW8191784.1 chemotaxis protein CheW [Synergistota bacterium]